MITRTKYPSTPHLPFSSGLQSDDRRIVTLEGLIGNQVVVTEKLDGENTTMARCYIHARSVDSKHHLSRDWVKQFWSNISYLIPIGWRICGENVYAQHSIRYTSLASYFYGFSVWDDHNVALSWDDTIYYLDVLFGIQPVPVLYRGQFDAAVLENLAASVDPLTTEGFVVRVTDRIPFDQFDRKVAKWVRNGHVQTDTHWMHTAVVANQLK